MKHSMDSYHRAYLASLAVSGFFAFIAIAELLSKGFMAGGQKANSIQTSILSVFGIALIPILAGGVERRPRLALGTALSLTIAFLLLFLYYICLPRKEDPIGAVAEFIGIAAVGLLFLCPWLLTSIRGALAIYNERKAQQGGGGQPATRPESK